MSAYELRQAAKKLRRRATNATQGEWKTWGMSVMADQVGDSNVATALDVAHTTHEMGMRTFNADYISTVGPSVGVAFADWLEDAAGKHDVWAAEYGSVDVANRVEMAALTVARLVNGGAA